ncbi:MAG: methyltransferase domain-containing protein [Pseudomonadota bacterium]
MNLAGAGYGDIFDLRGNAYAQAMVRWPAARDAEFAALFDEVSVLDGQRVLDVPAGGAYLRARLPQAQVTELEFSEGFSAGVPVVQPLGDWAVHLAGAGAGPFDHVVCLAALHHIQEGDAFVRRLLTLLGPGGVLHMADVPLGSKVAGFLDGFVGRYNQTGHNGLYRAADPQAWARLGRVLRCEERVVPWRFATDNDMLAFTAGLFGVRDCPMPELMHALETQVGVVRSAEGVSLQWRLWYVDLAAA